MAESRSNSFEGPTQQLQGGAQRYKRLHMHNLSQSKNPPEEHPKPDKSSFCTPLKTETSNFWDEISGQSYFWVRILIVFAEFSNLSLIRSHDARFFSETIDATSTVHQWNFSGYIDQAINWMLCSCRPIASHEKSCCRCLFVSVPKYLLIFVSRSVAVTTILQCTWCNSSYSMLFLSGHRYTVVYWVRKAWKPCYDCPKSLSSSHF